MCRKPTVLRSLCLAILTIAGSPWLPAAAVLGQAASASQPHLYFFTNDGCAPCLQVEPHIEALRNQGYPVTTVKVAENPQWAQAFQISATPTVVLVNNNRPVGRNEGLIRADELKRWFSTIGYVPGRVASQGLAVERNSATAVVPANSTRAPIGLVSNRRMDPTPGQSALGVANRNFSSPTMLQGTRQPANAAESRALAATVRLRVEDPEGISYATGTVIHSHQNESLVLTCGHVFRESAGRGKITAEYDFQGQPKTAPGSLISFDSNARDVGLLVIRTPTPIQPAPIAARENQVRIDYDVFSLGCDNGNDPTIRHSKIKNLAKYDGSPKYDIFGRPEVGRSGGGLFNAAGELIGVCNARAVDEDEGIYTALETLHWQLAHSKLDHLFTPATYAQNSVAQSRLTNPADSQRDREIDMAELTPNVQGMNPAFIPSDSPEVGDGGFGSLPGRGAAQPRSNVSFTGNQAATTPPPAQRVASHEVLILVRSKNNPELTETITIDDPTPELIEYLQGIQIRR